MAKTSRPKRQHYVPKFYLEHFIDVDGNVWNYDIANNEVRNASPMNTAVETNFYSVLNEAGDYYDEVESWLSGVESKASELYPKVLRGESLVGQEKADFAVFISSLFARSPALITAHAEMTGYLAQQITDSTFTIRERFDASMDRYEASNGKVTTPQQRTEILDFAHDKSQYVIQVDKKRGLSALGIADKLTEIFLGMTWCIFESPDQHLITSDNPVVRVNPIQDEHSIYGDGGFMNKRSNVSFPLSPSRILGLAWLPESPKGICRVDKQQGRLFNRQRAHFAERYLYASRRDEGIGMLGQKFKNPGLRFRVTGQEKLAPVEVKRNLS
jgi:Protein of unknown function (DUF4238)